MTTQPANEEIDQPSTTDGTPIDLDQALRAILIDVLALDPAHVAEFDDQSGLFGELPELDSMAVAGLLTEIEDRLNFTIDDQDVDGEMLETFGGLLTFIQSKTAEFEGN